jgi:hypothetical protein
MAINWLHFRATTSPGSYPGDGSGNTVNTGNLYSSTPTFGVYSHGWGGSSYLGSTGDDGTYNTQEIAGFATSTAAVSATTLRIGGLISGHNYNVYVALAGLNSSLGMPLNLGYTLYSDSGLTNTIKNTAGGSVAIGSIMDALGATFSNASNWSAGGAPVNFSATTTDVYFCKSSSGNNAWFNAIGIEDATLASVAPSSTLSMMGV